MRNANSEILIFPNRERMLGMSVLRESWDWASEGGTGLSLRLFDLPKNPRNAGHQQAGSTGVVRIQQLPHSKGNCLQREEPATPQTRGWYWEYIFLKAKRRMHQLNNLPMLQMGGEWTDSSQKKTHRCKDICIKVSHTREKQTKLLWNSISPQHGQGQ